MLVKAIKGLTSATAWHPHRSEDLDCDCRDCLKNVIGQLRAQVDVEREGYTKLLDERRRIEKLVDEWAEVKERLYQLATDGEYDGYATACGDHAKALAAIVLNPMRIVLK